MKRRKIYAHADYENSLEVSQLKQFNIEMLAISEYVSGIFSNMKFPSIRIYVSDNKGNEKVEVPVKGYHSDYRVMLSYDYNAFFAMEFQKRKWEQYRLIKKGVLRAVDLMSLDKEPF